MASLLADESALAELAREDFRTRLPRALDTAWEETGVELHDSALMFGESAHVRLRITVPDYDRNLLAAAFEVAARELRK